MGELPGFNDSRQKLSRLKGYLERDPGNLNLIADACAVALDAGAPDEALELLDRYEAIAPLPPALVNLKGLAALRQDRFDDAAATFAQLLEAAPEDPSLHFNLAWSLAMTGDHARAAELLDDATIAAVPAAGTLKVQALHHLGDLDGALQFGMLLAESRPGDSALLGALSLVAIDSRMPELALAWARRSQDTPEGLSSLGVLNLQDNHVAEAMACFDRGLALRPDSARNLLGKGLSFMAGGQVEQAVPYLDQSARIFGTHLGTWIAAGWAHFATGDPKAARSVFEHTMALDDTFAESHGALAVLDLLDGDVASARRRTETALRLDRQCFSGALAKSLLLEHDGNPQAAQKVRDVTLNTPVDGGRTIAQAMIALAPNWRSRRH